MNPGVIRVTGTDSSRLRAAARSLGSIRTYLHVLRIAHYYGYSHVAEVRRLDRGEDVTFAPNVSFRNAARITIGAGTHIGERSVIWAGNTTGRIVFGTKCLLAPNVTMTASNYGVVRGTPVMDQPKVERDIVLGDDVWLGANVVVLAGVTIGSGAIVGAGAVVTRDLPPDCIAGGVPARVIGERPYPAAAAPEPTTARSEDVSAR